MLGVSSRLSLSFLCFTQCFSVCFVLFFFFFLFVAYVFFFFFFFSSRRRHTRYIGDWSSDVCSSDLTSAHAWASRSRTTNRPVSASRVPGTKPVASRAGMPALRASTTRLLAICSHRSEERRVGKECRATWAQGDCRTKQKSKGLA